MTLGQRNTVTVLIYAVFCVGMLGVYALSTWQGNRRFDRLVRSMAPPPYVVVTGEVVDDQAELVGGDDDDQAV